MDSGGVVRSLHNWGFRPLPQKMRRHQQWHRSGECVSLVPCYFTPRSDGFYSYWTMHFDTSPQILHALNRRLRQDPRVIRWTMTKLGEKVEDITDIKEQTIHHTHVR